VQAFCEKRLHGGEHHGGDWGVIVRLASTEFRSCILVGDGRGSRFYIILTLCPAAAPSAADDSDEQAGPSNQVDVQTTPLGWKVSSWVALEFLCSAGCRLGRGMAKCWCI
jgi:hypothetical protein